MKTLAFLCGAQFANTVQCPQCLCFGGVVQRTDKRTNFGAMALQCAETLVGSLPSRRNINFGCPLKVIGKTAQYVLSRNQITSSRIHRLRSSYARLHRVIASRNPSIEFFKCTMPSWRCLISPYNPIMLFRRRPPYGQNCGGVGPGTHLTGRSCGCCDGIGARRRGQPVHQALVPAHYAHPDPADTEGAKMLRKHAPLVPHWFRAESAFSSGAVESMNNEAKLALRKKFGFPSYESCEVVYIIHLKACRSTASFADPAEEYYCSVYLDHNCRICFRLHC